MSDYRSPVVDYISKLFAPEDFLLNNILAEQEAGGGPMMNIGPDQGKFLNLLIKLLRPGNVLEVGSYYGYSSLWMARAIAEINCSLSSDSQCKSRASHLTCVELSAEYTEIILKYMTQAGVKDYVEVIQGKGLEMMRKFISEQRQFDIVFIDADKASYSSYLDLAYELLPVGGLLLVDNCLWDSKVIDLSITDKQTIAIRDFNAKLAQHPGFESLILTIQDGLAFAVKKSI